ncbi:unnamed protein product [Phytophthora fragariaefolia]|uniref:Unnamed protein product n=1 Tax=Phytophthora fragariaefolia TaxID=1490495 RepID=A0A9W7D5F8_9STRA|nr:unnamed protein product [Phytophthora fragariaefolia]
MKLLDPKYCLDTKMNAVSDSAFPCSTAMAGRILTPLKDGDIDRILPSLRSSARTSSLRSVRGHGDRAEGLQQAQLAAAVRPPAPRSPTQQFVPHGQR